MEIIDLFVKDKFVRAWLDNSPDDLDGEDEFDVDIFKKLVEKAMVLGLWGGRVGIC